MARPCFERFWSKVWEDPTNGCWVWIAAKSRGGYGYFAAVRRFLVRAHRYSYRQCVGPIPSWLELDHLCRNRACVNPSHLEAVTGSENSRRGIGCCVGKHQRNKTHCPQGHPYDEENTYHWRGTRRCHICIKGAKIAYRVHRRRTR